MLHRHRSKSARLINAELRRSGRRVDFGQGRGIDTEKACGNQRIRRKMRCFRAGAEGLISWLKRSLQMRESRWKGAEGFDSYVWAVIVTACVQAVARSG